MKTWVLLFRGINVGGRNLLPMKELRGLLEEMGFEGVRTYIQSGNVVLKSAGNPGNGLGARLEERFGFSPDVLVMEAGELMGAVERNPFAEGEGKAVHFYFCMGRPVLAEERVERLRGESEEWGLVGDVFYLFAPEGIGRSRLAAGVEGCVGVKGTGRNMNTVLKLVGMVREAG